MRLGPFVPVCFGSCRTEKPNQKSREKGFALPVARCARWTRATAQPPASLILFKGVLPTPVENPPVSRALPVDNPATLARGGRASIRLAADAVTWAGVGCAGAPLRACLSAPAARLIRWAAQASNAVGGVRGVGWTPGAPPLWTGAAKGAMAKRGACQEDVAPMPLGMASPAAPVPTTHACGGCQPGCPEGARP